ncbi:MAG: AMP-binding protein [Candidatus Marinimicrobia bacterium]|nr:AMP-binding protein [Candidatus Neomarinimicrobiota bacterium]
MSRKEDKVGILSENRPEWSMADWTCAHFNMVSVPVYHTSMQRQISYILHHAECKVVFVSTKELAQKLVPLKHDLPALQYIILMEDTGFDDKWILPFSELLKTGDKEMDRSKISMQEIADKIQPDDLWSIIYTSGTSGVPKGVMLSHFNIAANIQQTQALANFKRNKRWLSFLPLSHSLERDHLFVQLLDRWRDLLRGKHRQSGGKHERGQTAVHDRCAPPS